jgi:uracil-DNA glycosylase
MINSSLTVLHGSANKNCHANVWKWFTDKIIKYISDKTKNTVFVLWGSNAYEKINLIDLDEHEVIISSHPSGMSADKKMKNFPAFNDNDHFGKINEYLKKHNKDEIIWSII